MGDFLDMTRSGRIYLFGDGNKRLNPISGIDLAVVCIDKTNAPKTQEATAGGPDILSHKDIADCMEKIVLNTSLIKLHIKTTKPFSSLEPRQQEPHHLTSLQHPHRPKMEFFQSP